jgi:CubicO group peptidase (beta-lactamase class C family)
MPMLAPAAFDTAVAIAADQVADGTAPWSILGIAGADGVIRMEAIPGPSGRASQVTVDSVCLIASITKPIVATVVMQLVAEGRLALTAPLATYLPQVAAAGDMTTTAWHVLSHTSGYGDLDLEALVARGASAEELLPLLLASPRLSPLGTTFRYATSTFDLLGALIERVDGRPYPDALAARLFAPLRMGDTTFDPAAGPAARRILPLAPPSMGGGEVPAEMADAFTRIARLGGGLWSSAADLLAFGRAMLRGGELDGQRVLPRAYVELMTRETTTGGIGHADDPLQANHYALGWGRPGIGSVGSAAAFGHGGATGTRLWIDPGHDLVVAYLTGAWAHPAEPVDAVIDAVYAALP